MNIIHTNTNASEDALQKTIERFEHAKKNSDLTTILADSKAKYGLKNAAYLGYNLGEISKVEPFSIVTYSEDWINHYRANNYFQVDPVLKTVHKSILPLDWANVSLSTKKSRLFFKEAIDAGVGKYGISIPVQGRNGDFSVFSLTFDESERDWSQFKKQFMRDFQILAVYFHNSVLEINDLRPPAFDLTPRELEVLYWAACGKTAEETSVILGISERGVRFHVTNILPKLNAVNMSHAIAKAIAYHLINPPL